MAQPDARTYVPIEGRKKKPSIPSIQSSTVVDRRLASVLQPMKETIEIITGARGGRLEQLDDTADLDTVISKLNEVIAKLNY